MKLNCEICGKDYERRGRAALDSKTCSRACYSERRTRLAATEDTSKYARGDAIGKTEISCAGCGKSFVVVGSKAKNYECHKQQKYCSIACYRKHTSRKFEEKLKDRTCRQCGRPILRSDKECCDRKCSSAWRAAHSPGHIDKNGYHVFNRGGKYTQAQRMVMEKFLGRPLTKDETVHHRNGQRSDNRIANLELWSSRHGRGQRVIDQIAWGMDLLREYGFTVSEPEGWRQKLDPQQEAK